MKRAHLLCLALTVAAACLAALPANAAPEVDNLPKPIWFGQLAFSIPYNLSAVPAEQQPAQVQLYVSTDRGATWKLAQTVTTQSKNFDFRAPAEGEYGFLIREVDRQGRINLQPAGPPQLRVVVDVTPPKLELSAVRAPSGEVRASWKATDPLLNADSLKMEYQVSGGSWRAVAVDLQQSTQDEASSAGSVNVWPSEAPPAPAAVNLRAEILDRAGNPTRVQTKTQVVAADPLSAPPPEADRTTSGRRDPWNEAPTRWKPERSSAGPVDGSNPANPTTSQPDHADDPPRMARNPDWPPRIVRNDPVSADGEFNHPVISDVNPPIRNQMPIADPSREPRRNNRNSRNEDRPPRNDLAAPRRNGQQPRLVNSKSFEMDYEIQAVGPSGIAKVELWGTRDAGRTWTSYGIDNDNRTPMRVNVEGEGLYGFCITVQSGSGLASPLPRSGDAPEVLIAVDLTKPTARITDAKNGTGEHAGELLIRWEAADAGLAERPVTLQYSDNPAGPWSIIAADLAASGSYTWQPGETAPDRVYLRVEARDDAGNIGVYESPEAVPLDRIRPEGRIRGVRPITDSATRVQQYQFYR